VAVQCRGRPGVERDVAALRSSRAVDADEPLIVRPPAGDIE